VTETLIKKLPSYGYDYVVIVPSLEEARQLTETGVTVVLGQLDDPLTYQAVRLSEAVLLVATGTDTSNTNSAFTARSVSCIRARPTALPDATNSSPSTSRHRRLGEGASFRTGVGPGTA